jgi:carbohydrate kinase (thermoresistant glucokinase family)
MILIVAGVAGSGKTTVGELIAGRLNWTFADGDDFHPEANVAKMAAGTPLTDEDRRPWLASLSLWIDDYLHAELSAVLACSALKRAYRDELLGGRDQVFMAFLMVTVKDDERRLRGRRGHFFGGPLLASQFETLELPDGETRVKVVQSGGRPANEIAETIMAEFGLA